MEIQDGDDGTYVERIGVAVAPHTYTPMHALINWCVHNEIQHSHRVELLLVHVRPPLRYIPTPMGKVPVSQVTPAKLDEHLAVHEGKTQEFAQNLLKICEENKVKASFVVVESDNIAKMLVEQIRKYELLKFVIGAPAPSLFKMSTGTSEYVLRNSPNFCSIRCISKASLLVSSKNAQRNYATMSQPLTPTESPQYGSPRRSKSSIYISISPGSQSPTNTMHAEELERLKWLVELSTQETQPTQCVSQLLEARFPSYEISTPSNSESHETGEISYEPPLSVPPSMHNDEQDVCVDTDMPLAMESPHSTTLTNLEELKAAHAEEIEGLRRQLQEGNLKARQVIEAANAEAVRNQKACEKALWALRKAEEMILQREQVAESMKKALEEEKQKRQEAEYKVQSQCTQFSIEELSAMTQNFSFSNKVGENEYGTVYKGSLHRTDVAVCVLNWQGRQDFQHKVEVLSRLRHAHILLLLGGSSEHGCLVYEYLENGTLEDCLSCKNNTPPIPVYTRYTIAVEIASALLCIHKAKPSPTLHGSLKLTDVLLDRNFRSKLRLDRFIESVGVEEAGINPKAGVYSLGLILLRLLTGLSTANIVRQVAFAVDKGSLRDVLDLSAGEWPIEAATELACIGLRCAGVKSEDRPDLECVLEILNLTQSLFRIQKKKTEAPSHFLCPILHEVMQNPVVAADGYTYEYDQINRWIESKETSPMTNLLLENKNLIQNRVLKSAICEWRAKTIEISIGKFPSYP